MEVHVAPTQSNYVQFLFQSVDTSHTTVGPNVHRYHLADSRWSKSNTYGQEFLAPLLGASELLDGGQCGVVVECPQDIAEVEGINLVAAVSVEDREYERRLWRVIDSLDISFRGLTQQGCLHLDFK